MIAGVVESISEPSEELIAAVADWNDVLVLGAGGKMGSGVSSMIARAFTAAGNPAAVLAVSRWTDVAARDELSSGNVTTIEADLTDSAAVSALPEAERVIFLVGAKFGTGAAPHEAWMTNTVLPAAVASRYRASRVVALSTGNVYPPTAGFTGGASEDTPVAPIGEYAMSCVGRERVMQHAATNYGTQIAIVRLNYACDVRYGVLADIGHRVWSGEAVDVTVGAVNVVSQRYANEVIVRSMNHASNPPFVLNLAGPETASVRWIAAQFGRHFNKDIVIAGEEANKSLLSNASRCHALFGYPELSIGALIKRQAEWISSGGELWAKPTKFERTDGKF